MVHHLARRQFAEAERFSTALLRGTNSTFADKLEHLTVLLGGKSAQFESFVATVQREVGTNAFAVSDLVNRLTELGTGQVAINWATSLPAAIRSEPALQFAVAGAHFSLRQWRELETSLQAQQWKEREFPKEQWPIESLQNGYMRMRNTRGLYELTTLALERKPEDFRAQNNWATLSFLLETNLVKAHQLARQVYDREASNMGFVSTYAYSLHLQGKTAEALKVIETLKPTQLDSPSVVSYYGAMLAASGDREKARRYLAKAEAAPFLPEEMELIVAARKKL